jgi:hypothetical protein
MPVASSTAEPGGRVNVGARGGIEPADGRVIRNLETRGDGFEPGFWTQLLQAHRERLGAGAIGARR